MHTDLFNPASRLPLDRARDRSKNNIKLLFEPVENFLIILINSKLKFFNVNRFILNHPLLYPPPLKGGGKVGVYFLSSLIICNGAYGSRRTAEPIATADAPASRNSYASFPDTIPPMPI